MVSVAISSRQTGSQVRGQRLRRASVLYDADIRAWCLFAFLKAHLGTHEARRFFVLFTKNLRLRLPKTRGASDPMRDAQLLDLYHVQVREDPNDASLPRQLAETLNTSEPGKYGNSAPAIEKHLRRLLSERALEAEKARQMADLLDQQEKALRKRRAKRRRKSQKTNSST